MSHDIADTFAGLIGDIRAMTNSLSPRVRADIINYDPTQPGALSVTEFCRSQKISRSVFYKIRTRSQHESTATLHPRSRAPKQPARRYGPDVVNELVRIRKQLKTDGWDYGPKTIHYEALIADTFPGGKVPSPPRSQGSWPVSATSKPPRRSGPNPPTFPSPDPQPWPCGNLTPSNTL